MKLTRPLFVLLFLLLSISVFPQTEPRISATWQVQKYDITVSLPTADADRSLTAKADLTVKNISQSPATTVSLRINTNAVVSSVTVNGANADFSKREESIGALGSLQVVAVRVAAAAPGSTLAVSVNYKLNIRDNSGLSAISPVGSIFLPLSYWYPTPNSWYFAQGVDRAPVQVRVNAPNGSTVVSSGSENAGTFALNLNGQPSFLTGNWDVVNNGAVSVYLPKGSSADARGRADDLARIATDAKAFVSTLLGPAPDVPLRIVATSKGSGFSDGGTILVDESVFRRSKIDSLTATNIAEALAKLWIGGSVAVRGAGYGTISEGLPRFIATEFIESKYGKDVADVERIRQRMAYFAVARRDSPLTRVSPLDDYYFAEVANKGAMIWRLLDKKIGRNDLFANIQASMKDGELDVAEVRGVFSSQKDLLDYLLDQVTDMNLLVGLPQQNGAETKVALRNAGSVDVTVTVDGLTANGEHVKTDSTLRAASFGEVTFKSPIKITRVEIDTDKLYPQTEYSDDVAPREFTDSDLLLAVKRAFDKQDYAGAETTARAVLQRYPRYDDVRILLGRSLLAQRKTGDAGKEFDAVLQEKLPTARSLAWADEGLAEIAAKSNQTAQAGKYADAAIFADAEYGASLAARNLRNSFSIGPPADADVKDFFSRFDKAAVSNRKADVDALVIPGEATRFVSGVSGSTEQWQTQVKHVDRLDANTVLAETAVTLKLLNKDAQSGMAVFRLERVGDQWKLAAVEMFEVR